MGAWGPGIYQDDVALDIKGEYIKLFQEGKAVGDVDFDENSKKTSLITPPTVAVGPMTICMLAYNAAKSVYGREIDEILESGITKAKKNSILKNLTLLFSNLTYN
mgnify:FL=1